MPELPEVETIRRTLEQQICQLTIQNIQVFWPGALSAQPGCSFVSTIVGRTIESLERRGKYLLIHLDEGWTLIAHMRMTGRLLYYPESREVSKHTHVVFQLSKGELHFQDVRKFGRIQLVRSEECYAGTSLGRLGPEPLNEDFTPAILAMKLAGRKAPLKTLLLDQRVVAGLGNIYADESLFLSGLSPERMANSLTNAEIETLHGAIGQILRMGIQAQGTSFRDYRDAYGEKGAFQKALQVYGRGGEPCNHCGRPLSKKRLAGRTTVFCTLCQV